MYGKFEFAKIRDVQLKLNFVWSSSNVLLKLVIREFVSRDGLPRGVLPSGILKIEKYCPGLKLSRVPENLGFSRHRKCNRPKALIATYLFSYFIKIQFLWSSSIYPRLWAFLGDDELIENSRNPNNMQSLVITDSQLSYILLSFLDIIILWIQHLMF